MYNIGTVTATANSNKLVGTGTKWKENINGIQPQQVIQIVVGGIVYNSSIQSIESDSALTLNFPFHAAVKDAKYVILTTMVNSVSSAANYMVALNTSNMQARDVANAFMTLEGTVSMTAPDGTKVNLRTAKEMDKQLDGKFDKAGGTISGHVTATGNIQSNAGKVTANVESGAAAQFDVTGSMAKVRSRNKAGKWFDHTIPESDGVFLQQGDYGIGSGYGKPIPDADYDNIALSGFYGGTGAGGANPPPGQMRYGGVIAAFRYANEGFIITAHRNDIGVRVKTAETGWGDYFRPYTDKNTTKDAQGNLRAASPIVKVFADHIETNDESEGVTLEKLGVGRYKLKGVLGMNSDASWGGFYGGIVIPKGINGLELVWADYKVLADGDIILETHYRKHSDLPPPVVLNRLIAYPEFMDENGNELESYTPCDIPNGHWIDIRVQMPSDSIYNQKQAEAERLSKIEAERLAEMDIDV
ncbi:hypothetical protein [Providencia rettgeri]|uniref:phage tail fiber protein n=1 Tax=Providencia rettgeri TaxID=587 RepID=UPI00236274D4|nr:hypothetical protein [Providencia rettgeri]